MDCGSCYVEGNTRRRKKSSVNDDNKKENEEEEEEVRNDHQRSTVIELSEILIFERRGDEAMAERFTTILVFLGLNALKNILN